MCQSHASADTKAAVPGVTLDPARSGVTSSLEARPARPCRHSSNSPSPTNAPRSPHAAPWATAGGTALLGARLHVSGGEPRGDRFGGVRERGRVDSRLPGDPDDLERWRDGGRGGGYWLSREDGGLDGRPVETSGRGRGDGRAAHRLSRRASRGRMSERFRRTLRGEVRSSEGSQWCCTARASLWTVIVNGSPWCATSNALSWRWDGTCRSSGSSRGGEPPGFVQGPWCK